MTDADYKFSEAEADRWFAQKVYTNVLRCYLIMIRVSVARRHNFLVSRDLEKTQNILKKIIAENTSKPDADLIRELNEMLSKLPDGYHASAKAIKSLIEKLAEQKDGSLNLP